MAEADLLSLGKHCEAAHCHQLDFLPFTCDACGQVYCLDHRSYKAHNCSEAAGRETATLVCPLCAKAVKLVSGQDPNAAFEAHTSQDCDPTNYAKVHRKLKCPVSGCKEKLTSINTYSCKRCRTDVCLKHRFPSDHDCPTRKVEAAQQQKPLASAMRNFLGMGSGKAEPAAQPARKDPQWRAPKDTPVRASTSTAARAAAEAAERPKQSSSQPLTALTGTQPSAAASQLRPERCLQCGDNFRTLQELLFHVEAYHPDSMGSNVPSAGIEQCPHCGQSFADAVTLVEHVERNHARKELCVLC